MSPKVINIVPAKDPFIPLGITQEADEDEYASLLDKAYLALDPAGDNISILGDDASLTGSNVYQTGDDYLGASTETGHTSASNSKRVKSFLTQ